MPVTGLPIKSLSSLLICLLASGCAPTAVQQPSAPQPLGSLGLDQLKDMSLCTRGKGSPEPVVSWTETAGLERVTSASDALACRAQTTGGVEVHFLALPTKGSSAAINFGYDSLIPGTIGLLLKEENGAIMIGGVHPEGPAATNGGVDVGGRILGVAPHGGPEFTSLEGMNLRQAVSLIRGGVGEPIGLTILGQGEMQTRQITLTRGKLSRSQWMAFHEQRNREAARQLAIQGNTGQYLSPYTSDGVVAEWVNKAINGKMGGAAGSAVGAAAGAYAGQKLMENVPGGSMLGGLFGGVAGSKAGAAAGRNTAVEASGGMEHIRATSDLSFRSIDDMAQWLVNVHGNKANFAEVVNAATQIYPQLRQAVVKVRQ